MPEAVAMDESPQPVISTQVDDASASVEKEAETTKLEVIGEDTASAPR